MYMFSPMRVGGKSGADFLLLKFSGCLVFDINFGYALGDIVGADGP